MHSIAEPIVLIVDITVKADIRGIHAHQGTREIKAHLDLDCTHIFSEVARVFLELE